ncbi:SPW repeat protein [Actinopolymorpha cephalotaxi]|nr:SPW repeat protein [Actinopolymorpha cephalotaxi]NYH84611.1 Na+/phosphate symporter [Actinopolymorpha cephalotaxi]
MGAGLIVLAGLFVALSPWIAGFAMSTPLAVNNLVIGLTAVALALGFAASFRSTHGLSWVVPLLGVWTILAPWVMYNADHSLRVVLCNVIGGAALFLLGMAVLGSGMMRRKNERT